MNKLNHFTQTIRNIQHKYTKFKKPQNSNQNPCNHPWTNDRRYKALINKRKAIKKKCTTNKTSANLAELRNAHIACFALYNKLKFKYYQRIIHNTGGNSYEFYALMKTKTKSTSKIPPMLIKNGIKYFGIDKFDVLAKQLQESFTTPSVKFSTNHYQRYLQLEEIYDEYIDQTYRQHWSNYTEVLTIDDVAKIVQNLNIVLEKTLVL